MSPGGSDIGGGRRGRHLMDDDSSGRPSPGPSGFNKRKRGRQSAGASVEPSINGDEDGRESKKRKKEPTTSDTRLKQFFLECCEAVEAVDSPDGYASCELFLELPSKEDYADYYEWVKRPIAIKQIKRRINRMYYKSTEEFLADWTLMFNNARVYNEEGSNVVRDADDIKAALMARISQGINPRDGTPSNFASDDDASNVKSLKIKLPSRRNVVHEPDSD